MPIPTFLKLVLVLFLFTLIGCRKKLVAVNIDNEFLKSHHVILDGSLTISPSSVSDYPRMKLFTGKHTVKVDNGESRTFKVGGDGGILNPGNQEFVIFKVEYSSPGLADIYMETNFPIIIDSFVVYNRDLANTQSDLISLLEEEDSRKIFTRDLIKTPANQLFIDKAWEYNLDRDPPDSVYVRSGNDDMSKMFAREYKTHVMEARVFLMYASQLDAYHVELLEPGNKEKIEAASKLNN